MKFETKFETKLKSKFKNKIEVQILLNERYIIYTLNTQEWSKMRNNNLKNIIKVINTALLVSTLTLSLTACGRTDGKSDNSNNEADTAVVAVNNSDTDSMQNVNADDLSVNSDENQNTSEADNTSAVTDNENNADIEYENNSGDESISNDNSDYDTDNYTENGNNVDDNSQQPVYNDTFSYVSGGAEDDDTQENIQEAQHKTTICIDAGHGGSNEGTKETYDGVLIKEKDINLVIAKKLQWYLEQNDNLNVIMTRTSDTDVSIGGEEQTMLKAITPIMLYRFILTAKARIILIQEAVWY